MPEPTPYIPKASAADGPVKLVLVCAECGNACEVPFDGEKIDSRQLYLELGWILGAMAGALEGVTVAPICSACVADAYTEAQRKVMAEHFAGKVVPT